MLALAGCQHPATNTSKETQKTPGTATVSSSDSTNKTARTPRRFSYTPRPYPVDERGFSPVDKALAKAGAREEMVAEART